jgi:hypothetical protein
MSRTLSRRELIRRFRALGYKGPFSGGRHQFMVRGEKKKSWALHVRGDPYMSFVVD